MQNRWKRQKAEADSGQPSLLGRLRSDSRGNTLAMLAAAMVPIAAMVGSGLDMSRAYMAQAKLQNACDAAALAARREMVGNTWSDAAQAEGERFFEFNFPDGTMNSQNLVYEVDQSATDEGTVEVSASADVPTTIMSMFGKQIIPISVECDASQDYGNNDIMVVLDVTGSMNCIAGSGQSGCSPRSGSKLEQMREGAMGLYQALEDANDTRTRFGFMPYSMTVNVGGDLRDTDILDETHYWQERRVCTRYRNNGTCRDYDDVYDLWAVPISSTSWSSISAWRNSSSACIEERPTVGNSAQPIEIEQSVSRADIDSIASGSSDTALQWGRYVPSEVEDDDGDTVGLSACPARASRLRTFSNRTEYQNAVNAATATATVGGNTYHDIGITWGARYLSSTGMFAGDNPTEFNDVPVSKHIVFLTDGRLQVSSGGYSAYGYETEEQRLQGGQGQNTRHINHFLSACNRAKSMGMTIWVIALDEDDTDDIRPCASSGEHFFTSDGSDLEEVFEAIGQGIGRLRLTR
ncbi:MAG: pilus assembly protein TadG-related protein [Parasphingopyxis sp.]|uniref:TadE/TadG family type IV pilus assembly protein n=1 Tax=Parasphingopyxis sp. TaxID=1920299 RepID=UPI0032EE2299